MVSMFGQKSHGLSGVLLYAAYLTKGHKLKDYPVPEMTLSGDLDGLTRITRVMLTFKLDLLYVSNKFSQYSCHAYSLHSIVRSSSAIYLTSCKNLTQNKSESNYLR